MNLKEYLASKSAKELVREIIILTKKVPLVNQYYQNLLGESEDVSKKFKKAIQHEYFPERGFGKARAGVVKKLISEFRKVSNSKRDIIDLLLFQVEQGVDFTNEYGDIDERFYSSIESSFKLALKLIKKERSIKLYESRCLKIVEETDGIGWGFHDSLSDLYYSTFEDD